jgi:hypothetical protein
VLDWQIALARELGCERIILLGRRPDTGTLSSERARILKGCELHMLHGFKRLPAMLHSDDELLIVADGVVGNQDLIAELLSRQTDYGRQEAGMALRKLVLCLPSDVPQARAFPDDFERIDAERCWAGVLLMQAGPVQRLADFPPDSNPVSLLLRLALQAGIPCHTLSSDESAGQRWVFAHDDAAIAEREQALISQPAGEIFWSAPLALLADQIVRQTGARGLRQGEPWSSFAGLAALFAAILLALLQSVFAAVALCAAASFAFALAHRFARMKQWVYRTPPNILFSRLRDPGGDVLIGLIGIVALGVPAGIGPLSALAPLAIGTVRLAAASAPPIASAFWRDRTGQLVLLAVAAGLDVFPHAIAALALGALAQALLGLRRAVIPE